MIKVLGPIIYASDFINAETPGTSDAEKTSYIYEKLVKEITDAGSCIEDVIAVQKYVTGMYDNPSTREAYSNHFKLYKPSFTVVTYSDLLCEGGKTSDTCKVLIVAVKGCSKGESYKGLKLDRVVYPSGSPLEELLGYSRAVKAGPFVYVGGTTSVLPDKSVYGAGNSEEQDKFIWNKICSFANKAGADKSDIVGIKKWITKDYSGTAFMPDSECPSLLISEVPVDKLTREGQLEEVELFAVIGIGSGKVDKSFSTYFDGF